MFFQRFQQGGGKPIVPLHEFLRIFGIVDRQRSDLSTERDDIAKAEIPENLLLFGDDVIQGKILERRIGVLSGLFYAGLAKPDTSLQELLIQIRWLYRFCFFCHDRYLQFDF